MKYSEMCSSQVHAVGVIFTLTVEFGTSITAGFFFTWLNLTQFSENGQTDWWSLRMKS